MTMSVGKIVVFRLGNDLFAAGVHAVERVVRYRRARALPDVPEWVEGVVEYRSTVIPQIDLRRRFELPATPADGATRVLVLHALGGWVAVVVDAVLEVASYDESQLSPPPELFRGLAGEYLRGLIRHGERLVILLDVERILSATDRLRLEQAVAEIGMGSQPPVTGEIAADDA